MNDYKVLVITDKEELYDKCENMEQLFNKYYLPLLNIHYKKTYELQQENKQLKEQLKTKSNGFDSAIKDLCETTKQLQKRESAIDEAIEYITKEFDEYHEFAFGQETKDKILKILNKGKGDNNG